MRSTFILPALLATMIGCAGSEDQAAADSGTTAKRDTTPSMGGMQMAGASSPATAMAQHLKSLDGISGDSLRALLPAHRQMTANLLSTFNGEMRSMNMPADAAWNAVVDSLRRDLTRMPDLAADQLQAMMPEHRERVRRLMQMHADMMKKM